MKTYYPTIVFGSALAAVAISLSAFAQPSYPVVARLHVNASEAAQSKEESTGSSGVVARPEGTSNVAVKDKVQLPRENISSTPSSRAAAFSGRGQ
jgi:hypothetical protein